jgi:putative ABC transport system permease protein
MNLRNWLRKATRSFQQAERELDHELRFHVERRSEELQREGLSASEARRRALVELGGAQQIKEEVRAMRTGIWLETLWQDLRYAARQLRKNPGFAAVAILTLALGIGASTAIFTVVNAILLRPLPYADSQRLVNIWEDPGENPRNPVNPLNFADVRARANSFERLAAYYSQSGSLTGGGDPERVVRGFSTAGLFAVLRVQAALGRTFLDEEERAGHGDVALLSHGLWVRRFGSDPDILGKAITLDGERATVVGVLPPGLSATSVWDPAFDVWTPMPLRDLDPAYAGRGSHYLTVVGRLREGINVAQARSEVETVYERLRQQYPNYLTKWRVRVAGMHDDLVADVRQPLLVLMGAVGFLLLIACSNVANLLLARATSRRREVAVRTAVGATRGRLLRQLLTESLLLALLGAGAGLQLAQWGTRALLALDPALPRLGEIQLDYSAFVFALAISAAAGMLFGLAPAVQVSRAAPADAMKQAAASVTAGRGAERLRRGLVAAEVALALVLLVGAGLLMRSFHRLLSVDPGFDAKQVVSLLLTLPEQRYPEPAQQIGFFRQLLERVRALPGTEAAAMVSTMPLTGGEGTWENGFHIEGRPAPPRGQGTYAYLRWITPDYFRALRIPLQRGRVLSDADTAEQPRVIVVDETFVRQFFPNQDPIGQRIVVHWRDRIPREIVGVVGNIHPYSLAAGASPHMYVPYYQTPQRYGALLMRTAADPTSLARAVREQVQALDPAQPIYRVLTLEQILAGSVADRRFHLILLATFASTAVLLAAVGIYGVMACVVGERRREMAIRLAMGAERAQVIGLIVGQATKLATIGILAGIAGALALTDLLAAQLFDVRPTDPATFAVVAVGLCALTVLACAIPARRAAAVSPAEALRHE